MVWPQQKGLTRVYCLISAALSDVLGDLSEFDVYFLAGIIFKLQIEKGNRWYSVSVFILTFSKQKDSTSP